MRRNIKVYVAGPYSADNVISVLENIKNGIRVSVEVFLAGYSPFCPFIDYQFQFFLREGERLDVDDYYGYSLAWLTDKFHRFCRWGGLSERNRII